MRLVLHIGQHKTGSKALQTALHANSESLAVAGCAYPLAESSTRPLKAWERHHHALYRAVRRRAELEGRMGKHHASVAHAQDALCETVRTLVESVAGIAKTIILSSEDLFDMHTAHESRFDPSLIPVAAEALAEVSRSLCLTPSVVCYLRRQDHALAAHYAQFIKGTQENCLPLWSFLPRFAGRLEYEWIIACWARAFGSDAIMVRDYAPRLDGGVVQDFFTRVLGLTPPEMGDTRDPEVANLSPSRDHVEYMRLLNQRYCAGGSVIPRSGALESALRDTHPGARGAEAWLSPKARALLLARYGPGNARLKAKYGGGAMLSPTVEWVDLERAPDPPSLSIRRLLDLDARSREAGAKAPGTPRLALFVLPAGGNRFDEELARDLLTGMLGDPQTKPLALPRWTLRSALRYWRKTTLVVLSGPVKCNFLANRLLGSLGKRGTTVALCLGRFPENNSELKQLQRTLVHTPLLVCSNEAVATQLLQQFPFASRPAVHVAPRGHHSLLHLGQALISGGSAASSARAAAPSPVSTAPEPGEI